MAGSLGESTRWIGVLLCIIVLWTPAPWGRAAQNLSVQIGADPQVIQAGESTTLRWTSSGATRCWGNGAWGGSRNVQGSFDTGTLNELAWYKITCSDGRESVSDFITVVVRDDAGLKVSISASPETVSHGGSSVLSWSSSGAKWCWGTGGWSGGRNPKGTYDTGPLSEDTRFRVACTDGNAKVYDQVTIAVGGGAPAPSLELSASPKSVGAGGSSVLQWTASNVSSCQASGDWGGTKVHSGEHYTGPLSEDSTYRLSCSGGDGGVTRQVTVSVTGSQQLSAELTADPTAVKPGESTTLTWTSQGADSCTASGSWGGSRAPSGSFVTPALNQSAHYTLTCSQGDESALATVTVTVGSTPIVDWVAPTQNEDGSPLTDLAGYRVYYGPSSGKYNRKVKTGPNWTQFKPSALPSGTYYFAVTAVDEAGNESAYSNEIQVVIP